MSNEPPVLTPAEAEVMQALWDHGAPATVRQVQAALARPLAYNTVLTVMHVLEGKGYLKHASSTESGRAFVYTPALSRERARRHHVRDLVERLFGGHTPELAAGLIADEALTEADLQDLRRLIDSRLSKRNPKGRRER